MKYKKGLSCEEKSLMSYEYSDMLCSLLLAQHFGASPDVAIRQCAKRVSKRLTHEYVIKIAKDIRHAKSPAQKLTDAVSVIEEHYSIEEFLRIGFSLRPSASSVK